MLPIKTVVKLDLGTSEMVPFGNELSTEFYVQKTFDELCSIRMDLRS